MKGWTYYLLRVWRWLWISLTVMMLLVILLYFILKIWVSSSCVYDSRTISPTRGDYDAVVEDKCCGLIGSSCEMRVKLHRRTGWGLDTKIFVYGPYSGGSGESWSHEPVVVWLSANELEITVDRLDQIDTQLKEAHGVKITYRIGFVNSQFAWPIALEGEKVIGILRVKLTDASDDRTVGDIVLMLKDMVRLETYDVIADEELMRLVDERVKGIKDPRIKETTGKEVDLIRQWSVRARRLSAENGREPVKRREMFSLLRSEGFSGVLDIFVDFRPLGEIDVGDARLKLFIYVHNPEYPGWKGRQFKRLLIFSPAHYLGSYPLDQLPTGTKGSRLEFPGSEAEGNSIVFDSDLPPKKIYLGGKERELNK